MVVVSKQNIVIVVAVPLYKVKKILHSVRVWFLYLSFTFYSEILFENLYCQSTRNNLTIFWILPLSRETSMVY